MAKAVERVGDEIRINISARQHDAMACEADDLFFGGAAGGGKSFFLLLFSAQRRMAYPQSQGLMLRRSFRELENSLIIESMKMYPIFGATYHEQKKRWTFPNGSIQQFGYCDSEAEVTQYQSAQYEDICFDEASHFTYYQFSYITSRARTAIPGCKPLIRLASNPGSIGHLWLKKRYVSPSKVSKIWKDERTGKTLSFIPSRISDNPYLMEADPEYYNRLKELPENKFLALAEGSWDIAEGTFFEDWDERRHVLRHRRVPDTYTLKFISLDWGFSEPACALWWEITPMGRVYCYRELYSTQLHPKELAKKILEMSPESERFEYLVASPDIWGKKADLREGGETIHQAMQSAFGDRIIMQKAMNARVEGWLKLKEWLSRAPDGLPWMQFSPSCENLIRTLPGLVYETRPGRNPEDADDRAEDHCVESARYAAVSLMNVPRGALHPNSNAFDSIFSRKDQGPSNQAQLPATSRGGY